MDGTGEDPPSDLLSEEPLSEPPPSSSVRAAPGDVRRLLAHGLTSPDEGKSFGEYQLLRKLGQGGMGAVFEAEAKHVRRRVALKRLLEPELATESEERRFLFEAEAQSRLEHPNIVRVLHVGKSRGRPFFTMDLVPGGSLREQLKQRPKRSGAAHDQARLDADLELMAKVADAVAYAHGHGLLHRDLKPENILIDADGQPLLADFGLAKALDVEASRTEPGAFAGTVAYMGPEQAAGLPLTRAADVYSLGAILYELLTGSRQFHDTPDVELRARIVSQTPVQPARELDRAIPEEVERVCAQCLEKDVSRRYSNAAALRDDLRALLERLPTSIVPRTRWGRTLHWLRRHAAGTKRAARASIAFFAVLALVGYGWLSHARTERALLDTNAFIATAQAGAALFQLREYADRVEQLARAEEVSELAVSSQVVLDPPLALQNLAAGFDSVFVVSREGKVTAQWPLPPIDIWSRSYAFRDYFRGAMQLGAEGLHGAYVARAFRSERDGELKFGVSTPLYLDERCVGSLVAIIAADRAFGRLRMQDEGASGHLTALIGPRDSERGQTAEPGLPRRFVFLIHDALGRGKEIAVPDVPELRAAFRHVGLPGRQFLLPPATPLPVTDYRDPLYGAERGWLAAFAPVGGTGYVIVVQARADRLFSQLPLWQASAGLACLGLLVVGFVWVQRRKP